MSSCVATDSTRGRPVVSLEGFLFFETGDTAHSWLSWACFVNERVCTCRAACMQGGVCECQPRTAEGFTP